LRETIERSSSEAQAKLKRSSEPETPSAQNRKQNNNPASASGSSGQVKNKQLPPSQVLLAQNNNSSIPLSKTCKKRKNLFFNRDELICIRLAC
jgi:hypothetical protein